MILSSLKERRNNQTDRHLLCLWFLIVYLSLAAALFRGTRLRRLVGRHEKAQATPVVMERMIESRLSNLPPSNIEQHAFSIPFEYPCLSRLLFKLVERSHLWLASAFCSYIFSASNSQAEQTKSIIHVNSVLTARRTPPTWTAAKRKLWSTSRLRLDRDLAGKFSEFYSGSNSWRTSGIYIWDVQMAAFPTPA